MEYIIFRNPRVLYREESFGGIVKSNYQLLILGRKEFDIFKKLERYIDYSSLNKKEKVIADKFLELKIFLKINKSKAEKLISKKFCADRKTE